MKPESILARLSFIVIVLSFCTIAVIAQDTEPDYSLVIGEWEVSMEGRGGNLVKSMWKIELRDNNLVASIPMRMGRGRQGGGEPTNVEIDKIMFDGKKLTFQFEREGRNGTMVIGYEAEIADGKMKGAMAMGDRFSREFTGIKKK